MGPTHVGYPRVLEQPSQELVLSGEPWVQYARKWISWDALYEALFPRATDSKDNGGREMTDGCVPSDEEEPLRLFADMHSA
jgi:hypothetical protein